MTPPFEKKIEKQNKPSSEQDPDLGKLLDEHAPTVSVRVEVALGELRESRAAAKTLEAVDSPIPAPAPAVSGDAVHGRVSEVVPPIVESAPAVADEPVSTESIDSQEPKSGRRRAAKKTKSTPRKGVQTAQPKAAPKAVTTVVPASVPEATTPKVDTAPSVADASAPVGEPPALPDAAFDASKEKIKLPEHDGEILYYDTTAGQVAVQLDNSGGYRLVPVPAGVDLNPDELFNGVEFALMFTAAEHTQNEILLMAKDQKWKQIDAPVATKAPDTAAQTNQSERDPRDYSVLKDGDVWVGKDGRTIGIVHMPLTGPNGEVWMDIHQTWEENGKQKGQSGSFFEEDVRRMLREGSYVFDEEQTRAGIFDENEPFLPDDNRDLPVLDKVVDLGAEKKESKPTEAKEDKEKHQDLRELVDMQRREYASIDYKQKSAWMKVKHFLGKSIGEKPGDADTDSARQNYELALMKLQEAELEDLKNEGLTGAALRERMGAMIKFYQYDERIALAKERDRVKIEALHYKLKNKDESFKSQLAEAAIDSVNGVQNILAQVERMGRWYNNLSRAKKYALGGACLALGVAGGLTGGAAAAAAFSLVGARKALASAGLAVMADTFLEGHLEKKHAKSFEEGKEADLENLVNAKEVGEDYLAKLDAFLKEDIRALDKKFQAQKKEALLRRSVAWGGSLAAIFGTTAVIDFFQNPPEDAPVPEKTPAPVEERPNAHLRELSRNVERLRELQTPVDPPDAQGFVTAERPESVSAAASAVAQAPELADADATDAQVTKEAMPKDGSVASSSATTPESASTAVPSASLEDAADKPSVIPEASAERDTSVASLREEYKVTTADGKRGLWGILDKRLPTDIPEGAERNRAIQSLENAMRARLDSMTAQERVKLGFPKTLPDGGVNLDFIRPEDKIDFGKLLTAEEIQSVLDGKSIENPVAAAASEVRVGSRLTEAAANQAVYEDKIAELVQEKNGPVVSAVEQVERTARLEAYDTTMTSLTDSRQFLLDYPERKGELLQAVGKLRMEIFLLSPSEEGVSPQYDYVVNSEKLGGAKVAQVLKDLEGFKRLNIGYDRNLNPLHPDQMKDLSRFVIAAEKAFGEVAQVRADENIQDYTKRMATAALRTGKAIRGFYKPSNPLVLAA